MSHAAQGLHLSINGDCTQAVKLLLGNLSAEKRLCAYRCPGELPQPLLGWVTQPKAKDDTSEKIKDKSNQSA